MGLFFDLGNYVSVLKFVVMKGIDCSFLATYVRILIFPEDTLLKSFVLMLSFEIVVTILILRRKYNIICFYDISTCNTNFLVPPIDTPSKST